MTEGEKKKRRDRISRVAEARDRPGYCTVWLTRNRHADGNLSAYVDVWLLPPVLRRYGESLSWNVADPDARVQTLSGPKGPYLGAWTLEECVRFARTIPDDERQCIRKGGTDPVLAAPE